MAHGYDGSRSPVRAIGTGTRPTWGTAAPHPRSWSEPQIQEITPTPPTPLAPPELESTLLTCPDCGSRLRLALVSTAAQEAAEATPRAARPPLHTAPGPGALPPFEDSIQRHKRALIVQALEENDGVMTRAAKALGLKYTTFVAMAHRLDALTPSTEEIGAE